MYRCVSIKFAGATASYEPLKWQRILTEGIACQEFDHTGILSMLHSSWLSEFPNSLNLLADFRADREELTQLEMIRRAFLGAEEATIFGQDIIARHYISQTQRQCGEPKRPVLVFRKTT